MALTKEIISEKVKEEFGGIRVEIKDGDLNDKNGEISGTYRKKLNPNRMQAHCFRMKVENGCITECDSYPTNVIWDRILDDKIQHLTDSIDGLVHAEYLDYTSKEPPE
ncbi:hypothetical protein H8S90_21305 [Olivibacter sp. SDN3]|uniref:hypothetical protein n=1 Tax=Olivibacter sp. SDN3 TaxID=2764720 RepID=UPI0016516317|nr:hypothetical protein [Olivibacter sp. SDN3]QNL49250.1 hypothetical protein H8S90_21305 [Olivibacter sp. SDN3]